MSFDIKQHQVMHSLPDDVLKDTHQLKQILSVNLVGRTVINEETGHAIKFFSGGLKASLKNRKALARKMYLLLPDLMQKARLIDQQANTKTEQKVGILGYEYYGIRVKDGGSTYLIKIEVDVVRDGVRDRGYYYHQIEVIEE